MVYSNDLAATLRLSQFPTPSEQESQARSIEIFDFVMLLDRDYPRSEWVFIGKQREL